MIQMENLHMLLILDDMADGFVGLGFTGFFMIGYEGTMGLRGTDPLE